MGGAGVRSGPRAPGALGATKPWTVGLCVTARPCATDGVPLADSHLLGGAVRGGVTSGVCTADLGVTMGPA